MAFNCSSYVFTENHPAERHAGDGQVGDHAEPRGRPLYTQAVVPHSASVSGASACHDSEHPLFTRAEGDLEITASTHSRVSPLMDPYHPNQDSQSQDPGDWPAYPPLDLPAGQAPFERHAATSTSFEHSFHHQNPSQNPTFSQQHDQNHPPQQQPQPHQQHQLHRLPFSQTPSHSQSQHHAQSHLGGSAGSVFTNTSSSAQSYHDPRRSYASHPTNTFTGYGSSSTPGFHSELRGSSRSQSQYSSHYGSQYIPPPSRLVSPPQLSTPMGTSLRHHQQQHHEMYDHADHHQPPPQRHSTGTTRLTSTPSGMSMSMHGTGMGMGLGMGLSSVRTASPPRRGHAHGQGYTPSHPRPNAHSHSLGGSFSHQHHLDLGVGSSSNSPLTSVASHNPHLSNIGSQRFSLNLAGSLDPTTGIFYRSPEHPRLRTAQACEKCRTRKAKCSGEHPACKRCITRGLVCEYAKEGRVRGPNKPKSQAKNGAGGAAGASSSNTGDAPSGSGMDGGSGGEAPERTDTDVEMSTDEAQYQRQDTQEQGTSPGAAGGAGRGESSVPPSRRRHAAAAAAAANLQGFQRAQRQRQQDSNTPSSQDSVAGAPGPGEHRAALSSRRSHSQVQTGGQPQPIALGMGLLSTSIPAPVPLPLESPTAFGLGPVTGAVPMFAGGSSAPPSPYSYAFPGAGMGAPQPVSSSSSSIPASSVSSSLSSSVSSTVSSMSTSSATIAQRRGVSPHTHALGLGQGVGLRGTSGIGSVSQAPQTRLAAHIPISSAYPYSIPSRTVSHAHAEGIVEGGTPHGHENLSASAYMHSSQDFQPVYDARGTYHQQPQYEQQQQSLSYHEQLGDSSGYQQQEDQGHGAYMQYQDEPQHQHDPQGQYTGASNSNDTHPYGTDDDGSRTTRILQYPLHNAPGQGIERDDHRSSNSSGGGENDRGAESTSAAFHPVPSHPPPPVCFLSSPSAGYSHDTSVSPIPAPATYLYAASSLALSSTPTPSRPMLMPSTMMPPGAGGLRQQQIIPAAAPGNVNDDRQQRAIDLVNERNPSRTPSGAREDVPVPAQSQVDEGGGYAPQELHYTYVMGQQQQRQYQDEEQRRGAIGFFQPHNPSDTQRSASAQQLQHFKDAEAGFRSDVEGGVESGTAPTATTQEDANMVLDDVECPPPIDLPPPSMVQAMVYNSEGGTHDAGTSTGAGIGIGTGVYNADAGEGDALAGAGDGGGGCVSSVVDASSRDPGLSASDAEPETARSTSINAPHSMSEAPLLT